MADNPPPQDTLSEVVHRGGCFCGAVSYAVTGLPILRAYCHCTLCQRLTAAAFIHTIHFPASAFTWTHKQPHEDALELFVVPEKPWKKRWRCKHCGVCVSSHNTKANKWSVWGAQMERDETKKMKGWDLLKPTHHMFYGTRMLDVDDELPKWSGYSNQSSRI